MGLCNSKPSYIASATGGEREYQERYVESKTLGQGEFGVVKMVHDVKQTDLINAKPLAVKYLRKGYTFRDNTLYTPLKKEVLQGEVDILRALNGECYNLKLVSVYESPSMIYVVTEYCDGGEMVPWVSHAFEGTGGLRTEDVSRVCYQLWSAVAHCAKHRVIHRDIKPENVMFCSKDKDSELRLIDFGSGTIDGIEGPENKMNRDDPAASASATERTSGSDDVDRHHTFAGSAFYISPEMFQRTYTSKTDVWSAGATLYVLVAGYPADRLQETFNVLQSTKSNRLRGGLPNLPDNMPDSFYEMLEGSLTYRHKARMDADHLMKGEFAQFHIRHREGKEGQEGSPGTISLNEVVAEATRGEVADEVPEMALGDLSGSKRLTKTTSVLLEGSVNRHNAYLGYQKFERGLTTVLATMLSKETCRTLLLALRERHTRGKEEMDQRSMHSNSSEKKEEDRVEEQAVASRGSGPNDKKANAEKLQVVTINTLMEVLEGMQVDDDGEVKEVIAMIKAMQNFNLYKTFAYHVSLLRQFVSLHARPSGGKPGSDGNGDDGKKNASSVHGNNVWSSLRKRKNGGGAFSSLDISSHRYGGRDTFAGLDASIRGLRGRISGGGGDPDGSVRSNRSGSGPFMIRRINTATGNLSSLS